MAMRRSSFGTRNSPALASRSPRQAIYILHYRYKRRVHRYTIGRHDIETNAYKARNEAIRLRGLIASGNNPATERTQSNAPPTIAEFAERYMQEHAIPHKKPSSAATDRRNLDHQDLRRCHHHNSRQSRPLAYHGSIAEAPSPRGPKELFANRSLAVVLDFDRAFVPEVYSLMQPGGPALTCFKRGDSLLGQGCGLVPNGLPPGILEFDRSGKSSGERWQP